MANRAAAKPRRATGPGSRVTNAILNGTYELLESGPLNVTAGEREVIAAMRRIPGDDARRVRVVRAVAEFLDLYLDGVRRAKQSVSAP